MTVWGVLAGGLGRRYGAPKVSARFEDGTFLSRCLITIDGARATEDPVVVSLALGADDSLAEGRMAVHDLTANPGPAHSIARLAEFAARADDDLVFMAVDMLNVRSTTLAALAQRLSANRRNDGRAGARAVVARGEGRAHWVLGGVPRELHEVIIDGGASVEAVQSILRLCPLEYLDVPAAELLDVNTRDLLPNPKG